MPALAKRKRKSRPTPPPDRRHIIDRLGPAHPLVARYRELGHEQDLAIRAHTNSEWGILDRGPYGGYSQSRLLEIRADIARERREILAELYRMDREEMEAQRA